MLLFAITQTGTMTVTFPSYGQDHDQQDSDADGEQGTGK